MNTKTEKPEFFGTKTEKPIKFDQFVNVSNKQITTSENIPPQRREVVVSGDGNCFYLAVAIRKDEISGDKHQEIPRSSVCLRIIQRFLSCLFLFELLGGSCQEKQDHGNSCRNCSETIQLCIAP